MKHPTRWFIVLAASTMLTIVGTTVITLERASGHHPDVAASSTCVDGAPALIATATAWQSDQGDDHRINSDVRITVDGIEVGKGAFAAPNYRFVIAVKSTPGVHTVAAIAVGGWGPQGQYPNVGPPPTTQVTVIDACRTDTTVTTTTRPVTVITTPPVVRDVPPTSPAIPVDATPRFAG